jgi:hypothetical protein
MHGNSGPAGVSQGEPSHLHDLANSTFMEDVWLDK